MWLPTKECNRCHTNNLFDADASDTFIKNENLEKELEYEKGSAKGFIASDRVCLDTNTTSCVDDQLWIAIEQSTDLDAMKCDGILGLSPGDVSLQDDERRALRGNNTNRFIENLYEQGKIQERVFSFFLSEYNNYREIPAFTIGGYDIEKFAPNQTLTWNYVTDDTYWTVKLSQVSLGDR